MPKWPDYFRHDSSVNSSSRWLFVSQDSHNECSKGTDESSIQNAIAARKEAKATRDFAKADQIRDDLKALGIELIDKPGGITEWIRN